MWGPSLRNIVRSLNCIKYGKIDYIEAEVRDAAARACKLGSEIMAASGGQHMPTGATSSLVFVGRAKPEELGSSKGFIPTDHLIGIFEEHRCKLEIDKSLDLFIMLSSHSLSRSTAGWGFEIHMHRHLSTGGAELLIFQSSAKKSIRASTYLPCGTLAGLGQADVSKSFYWIPSVANFPGIDSVLGDTDGQIYTLQATIAPDHTSPIDGIVKAWKQFPSAVQKQCTWHYVVVTNTQQAAESYVEKASQRLAGFVLGGKPVQVWGCALLLQP